MRCALREEALVAGAGDTGPPPDHLRRPPARSATVTRLPAPSAVGLREATGPFTGRDRFEPTTVAAYRETLDALWGHLGEIPVDAITADQIEGFLQARWGAAAQNTFNRLCSLLVYAPPQELNNRGRTPSAPAFPLASTSQRWSRRESRTHSKVTQEARKPSVSLRTDRCRNCVVAAVSLRVDTHRPNSDVASEYQIGGDGVLINVGARASRRLRLLRPRAFAVIGEQDQSHSIVGCLVSRSGFLLCRTLESRSVSHSRRLAPKRCHHCVLAT